MKKYFLTGLAILLPLAVTIAIVAFIVNFLTQPFIGLTSAFLRRFDIVNRGFFFINPQKALLYGSQILILIGICLFTVLLGIITRWFLFKTLLNWSDQLLHRIPLVNKVYKTTQEIIKTLFTADKNSFKQVVMAPFPKEGAYMLGLISRKSPNICSQATDSDLYSVLIPTTPNPTTGFLVMYKKEELIFLEMSPEDAIKYIVSCGVIIPPGRIPTSTEDL